LKAVPAVLLAAVLAQSGCASHAPTAAKHYAVRSACGDARNCYATIQAALDASATEGSDDWVQLDIAPGSYAEKVTVHRPKTRLRGSGAQRTFLRFNAAAEYSAHFHRDLWGTPGSATLTIDADRVTVVGMTVENTFDYLANDALPDSDPHKIANSQALALLLDKHSDRVLVEHAALLGYQDTLFADGRRALVRDSFISGNVDFIFGGGELLVVDSTIQSRRRAAAFPAGEIQSFVAAPSTLLSQRTGITVYRSRLTREPGVPDGSVALGRPWHPTRKFPDGRYADPDAVGQVSFIDCHMDAHIHADHWASMAGTARDGTKTHVFQPQDARFFESGSRGPGARHTDIGLRWSDAPGIDEVKRVIFDDWPEAGFPK
jgi:pectinesterase